jgi:SAM-dependent methyltransferase
MLQTVEGNHQGSNADGFLRHRVKVPPMDDRDPTWRYTWPAGERMAADLAALTSWTGLRVAELGCGQGRCGRAALRLGAGAVVFCDISREPLEHLASQLADQPRARFAEHAWGTPVPDGPYARIIGSDILYRPAFFARLIASIASSLSIDGEALLADPRTSLDEELPGVFAIHALSATVERRPGPYTLVRLRRTPMA